ncbi:hypothetical protein GCM10010129_67890 [Streptomyces fumigatiscleroticus]|nr:hypothetical protein GCM10010129_67890 [Streptomyces fumigatiscleroticus]
MRASTGKGLQTTAARARRAGRPESWDGRVSALGGFMVAIAVRVGQALAEAIVAHFVWELCTYVRSRYAAAAVA